MKIQYVSKIPRSVGWGIRRRRYGFSIGFGRRAIYLLRRR